MNEKSIIDSIKTAIEIAKSYLGHEETITSISKAIKLSKSDISPNNAIELINQGWVAEEAIAIAVYCALKENNF